MPPLPQHLADTLLKAWLPQFSHTVHCVWLARKKLQGILKDKKHSLKRQSKHRTRLRYDRDVGAIRLGI